MTDFSNFLAPEDEFNLEFERYFNEFMAHAANDTLDTDQQFRAWTIELMEKGEKIGVDLQKKVMDTVKEKGRK